MNKEKIKDKNVRIKEDVLLKLKDMKIHPRQSYSDVIKKVIKNFDRIVIK